MAHFAFEMLCSIEKCQEQGFRKELLGFGAKAPLISGFTGYTYYASAKGYFMDYSLRVEMTWPDSMNDMYIETFPVIGK